MDQNRDLPRWLSSQDVQDCVRGALEPVERPSLVTPHPGYESNRLLAGLDERLAEANARAEAALEDSRSARSDARSAIRRADLANIIATIAIAIAAKDQIFELVMRVLF